MPMVNYTVDASELGRTVARFSGIARVDLSSAWLRALRRLARYMQSITPPGDGRGNVANARGLSTDDRRRGQNAIARDLRNLFIGVKRGSGVPGMDPDPIHRRLFAANKRPGRKLRRDRAEPYPVDMAKVARLERMLFRRVGKTAAQWNPGFRELDIRPPAWLAKQTDGAAKGAAERREQGLRMDFSMTANAVHDAFAGEVQRRSAYALRYTDASIAREAAAILERAAGRSGFRRAA